ncbi:hypothetical protein QJ854_gp783 [Moumouvirus goulette]|uniref:Uncharacterized protein n=1 Tax=Moumouvirus goulette TaxID=1247379 RepID=M1PAW9_9VIRU|nr:hypothetical protein QJ854_gp783 [Moumouvirus goulette]AGF84999.1 hypothetical protein glt_00190 [Moumouvirus goulette]
MSYMNIPQEWYEAYLNEPQKQEEIIDIYIDKTKIIEPQKQEEQNNPLINFDEFIIKTQKFFQYFFSPKFFTPNNQEIDSLNKDIQVLNLV